MDKWGDRPDPLGVLCFDCRKPLLCAEGECYYCGALIWNDKNYEAVAEQRGITVDELKDIMRLDLENRELESILDQITPTKAVPVSPPAPSPAPTAPPPPAAPPPAPTTPPAPTWTSLTPLPTPEPPRIPRQATQFMATLHPTSIAWTCMSCGRDYPASVTICLSCNYERPEHEYTTKPRKSRYYRRHRFYEILLGSGLWGIANTVTQPYLSRFNLDVVSPALRSLIYLDVDSAALCVGALAGLQAVLLGYLCWIPARRIYRKLEDASLRKGHILVEVDPATIGPSDDSGEPDKSGRGVIVAFVILFVAILVFMVLSGNGIIKL